MPFRHVAFCRAEYTWLAGVAKIVRPRTIDDLSCGHSENMGVDLTTMIEPLLEQMTEVQRKLDLLIAERDARDERPSDSRTDAAKQGQESAESEQESLYGTLR